SDAANAVTARTTVGEARAEPDAESRRHELRGRRRDRDRERIAARQANGETTADQSGDEDDSPQAIVRVRGEDSADDAADARDSTGREQEEARREADQHTARERRNRGEVFHGSSALTTRILY